MNSPAPTTSPQKGLPGFLRRSIRSPYSEGSSSTSTTTATSPLSSLRAIKSSLPIIESTSPSAPRSSSSTPGKITPRNFLREYDTTNDSSGGDGLSSTTSDDTNSRSLSTPHMLTPARTTLRPQNEDDTDTTNNSSTRSPMRLGRRVSSTTTMNNDSTIPVPSSSAQTSGLPPRSVSSPTTTTNTTTTGKKSYRDSEFEKIMGEPVVTVAELRRLGWNGIPSQHRPTAWKILLGYLPTNSSRRTSTLNRKRSEYRDAVLQHHDLPPTSTHLRTPQEQETLRQVLVDVPRTAPDVGIFRNEDVRRGLERLLHVWAVRHPASSYVQGINDLATPLLAVFLGEYCEGGGGSGGVEAGVGVVGWEEGEDGVSSSGLERLLGNEGDVLSDFPKQVLLDAEADCYWCLTNLLAGIQDHYTSDQPGVQRMVMRLEELVMRIDAGLAAHLQKCGVEFMQFAFRWMNCLLLREFELRCVVRLWDTYLSEGDGGFEGFHVYVCAAFLCQFSEELKGMQFDEIFGFMQNIPTSSWSDSEIEILLSQAFVLSTLFQGSDAHLVTLQK